MNRLKIWYVLIAVVSIITCIKVHQNKGYFNWQSEIWTDQAGYYTYNPYLFIYGLDASKFPEKIEDRTGIGFRVIDGKMKTKYTSGVAALQLPFFILVDLYVQIKGGVRDGFSGAYHNVINLSALFYFLAALYLLLPILRHYFSEKTSIFYLLLLSLGTNAFYYAVGQNGMSHIYSFFLFIAFWRLIHELFIFKTARKFGFLLLVFVFGLIVLVRPTNIIIALLLFWNVSSKQEAWNRIKSIFTAKRILLGIAMILLVFAPQFFYWHSISGSFVNYSYGNEAFIYKYKPQLLSFWFAPKNGMFPYTPVYLIAVVFCVYAVFKRSINGLISFSFFLVISYMSASWHQYYFGCGFGARNMVEYAPFLLFPLVSFIEQTSMKPLATAIKLTSLTLGGIGLIVMYNYNYCFGGTKWDWRHYLSYYNLTHQTKSINEKEEVQLLPGGFSKAIEFKVIPETFKQERTIKIWADLKSAKALDHTSIVLSLQNDSNQVVSWSGFPLKDQFSLPNEFQTYYINVGVANDALNNKNVKCYVWNEGLDTLTLHDLTIQVN